MVSIEFLKVLAQEFRGALEIVVNKRLYGRLKMFGRFPSECCRYTSDLLAEYIMSKGIAAEHLQTIDAVSDEEQYTHCWVVVDNTIIVDITADQFNTKLYFEEYKPIPRCYVEMCNTPYLYERFYNSTLQHNRIAGINSYSGDVFEKLKHLYDAIIGQIEKGD